MEGDAGASRLNPIESDDDDHVGSAQPVAAAEPDGVDPVDPDSADAREQLDALDPAAARRPEHFGRGWFAGVAVLLVVVAVALGVGGCLALRANRHDDQIARDQALALDRAKECVAATQAPDVAAIAASQTKIIECGTGAFAAQSSLYSSVLVDAYQAAKVSVKVADLRAAVERYNPDRSVDVLVAVRVSVTNSEAAGQQQGYRLLVQMAPADGTYKINKLDQVTS